MIHTVVYVVENFPVSSGFSYYLRNQSGCSGHHKSSRFGYNLDVMGKQAFAFGIYYRRELSKLGDMRIVRHWKSPADIDYFKIVTLLA